MLKLEWYRDEHSPWAEMTCKLMKCPIFLKTQLWKIIKVSMKSVYMFTQFLICVQLFVTPWIVSHQASLSMEFSRGFSWPRDWIRVSHTAGRFFTIWAIREAPKYT